MSALEMCHAARRAWERSQPQLTIDALAEADGSFDPPPPRARRPLDNNNRPAPHFLGQDARGAGQEDT